MLVINPNGNNELLLNHSMKTSEVIFVIHVFPYWIFRYKSYVFVVVTYISTCYIRPLGLLSLSF